MVKVAKVKEKVSDKLNMPKDIVLNMPVIRVVGDKEILVENHKGLLEYTSSTLKLKSNLGNIVLKGSGFQIKDISDENIYISGTMESLNFVKEE